MKRFFVFIITVCFIAVSAFPAIVGNEICRAYPEQCAGGESNNSNPGYASIHSGPTVSQYIKIAGFFFLKGKSSWCDFTSEYEISGEIITALIYEATYFIERSNATYKILHDFVLELQYNPDIIEKLKAFDYDNFQEKNSLNSDIFGRVKCILETGNVNNIFLEFVNTTRKIKEKLKECQANPSLSNIWEISLLFDYMETFGQYIARIFYEI